MSQLYMNNYEAHVMNKFNKSNIKQRLNVLMRRKINCQTNRPKKPNIAIMFLSCSFIYTRKYGPPAMFSILFREENSTEC